MDSKATHLHNFWLTLMFNVSMFREKDQISTAIFIFLFSKTLAFSP